MKRCFYTIFWCLIFSLSAKAQCDNCPPVAEVTFQDCYTHSGWVGHCAMFTDSDKTFYYADTDRKKRQVMEFPFPVSGDAGIEYLMSLTLDKRLKLKSDDLAFIQKALQYRLGLKAIENWKASAINSGFSITPSGLAYKVLREGNGDKPNKGNSVSVHYTGYFAGGKKFDSSRDRKQPFRFNLGKGQVIKGWDEGVAMMKTGGRYLFRIPAELAYGARGYPGAIPPNSTLYFDVQLLKAE